MRLPRFLSRPSARLGAAFLAAAWLAPSAPAQDRVILKSGEKIEGRVVGEAGESLRIDVGYGEIRVKRATVAPIDAADPKSVGTPSWSVDSVASRPEADRQATPARLPSRRIRGVVPSVEEPVEPPEPPESRPASRPVVHPAAPPDLGGTF